MRRMPQGSSSDCCRPGPWEALLRQAVYPASLPCASTVSIGARLGSPKVFCPAARPKSVALTIVCLADGVAEIVRIGARFKLGPCKRAKPQWRSSAKLPPRGKLYTPRPRAVPEHCLRPVEAQDVSVRRCTVQRRHAYSLERLGLVRPNRGENSQCDIETSPRSPAEKPTSGPRCELGVSGSWCPVSPWPACFPTLDRLRELH